MAVRPDLNGDYAISNSSNGMTQKELLVEVREDVKILRSNMDILVSQDLHRRLCEVEEWQTKTDGRMDTIVRGVPLLSSVVTVITGLLILLGAHFAGVV